MTAKDYHNKETTFSVGMTIIHVTDEGQMCVGRVKALSEPDALEIAFEDGEEGTERCATCFPGPSQTREEYLALCAKRLAKWESNAARCKAPLTMAEIERLLSCPSGKDLRAEAAEHRAAGNPEPQVGCMVEEYALTLDMALSALARVRAQLLSQGQSGQ